MKRIITLAALALTTALAVPAMADPAAGKWGLGYFRPEAPIGVRYWFSEKAGLDLGVGFSSDDAGSETLSGFTLDIGVPFVMAHTEKAFFFVRPGFGYNSQDQLTGAPPPAPAKNTPTTMGFALDLGVEYFFNDNFSVQVAHGIGYKSTDPDVSGADNVTGFATEDFGISNIGFHYYFK